MALELLSGEVELESYFPKLQLSPTVLQSRSRLSKDGKNFKKRLRVNIRDFLPQFYPNSSKVQREHYMAAHGYNFLSTNFDAIFHE